AARERLHPDLRHLLGCRKQRRRGRSAAGPARRAPQDRPASRRGAAGCRNPDFRGAVERGPPLPLPRLPRVQAGHLSGAASAGIAGAAGVPGRSPDALLLPDTRRRDAAARAMSVAIVIAPLSNDTLRDWPLTHFERLAGLCVDRLDARIDCVGIRAQRVAVNQIVRNFPPDRVRNLCGTMAWADTAGLLRSASCVVANNSGIAHLAAELGVPTVCVFGASHNPYEWMARGPRVTT